MIDYEVATNDDPNNPKRVFRVDRYSEAPRSILEDIVLEIGQINIVERQRLDQMLLESEFSRLSGFVDAQESVTLGKLLGASFIIMGTINDVSSSTTNFKGYGIKSKVVTVQSNIRLRVIEIKSGNIVFSRILKGKATFSSSNFGGSENSDVAYQVINAALEKLRSDQDFKELLSRCFKQTDSGKIRVKFTPKPNNCDIEIDGIYIGGSPINYVFDSSSPIKIKISKAGHETWESTIIPRKDLVVKPELIKTSKEGG